jgi:hypothetical protein
MNGIAGVALSPWAGYGEGRVGRLGFLTGELFKERCVF